MKLSKPVSTLSYDGLIHIPKGFANQVSKLIDQYQIKNCRVKSKDFQIEYLCFFISLLYLKQQHYHGADDNQEVPLNSTFIRNYESNASAFLKWLCDRGILTRTGYQAKVYSRHYKFAQIHEFEPAYLKNPVLIQKIEIVRKASKNEIEEHSILGPLFQKIKNGVELLPEANNWEGLKKKKDTKKASILRNMNWAREKDLDKGYFMSEGQSSGRIFSPHAHLPNEVRKLFLRINGEMPAELDLRCSQFQILYLLFKNHQFASDKLKQDFDAEMVRYAACFRDPPNDLYSIVGGKVGWSRAKCKKRIIPWLFASYAQVTLYPSFIEMSALFKSCFPMLFDLIMEFKKDERNNIAVELQKIESTAVIKRIAIEKLCREDFSFVTIHDSILIPLSKFDLVKGTIWEPTLKELGFPEFLSNSTSSLPELSIFKQNYAA